MGKSKRGFRINFFDIVILLIVLVLAGGFYFYTHRETVVETHKIRYTLELTDLPVGYSEVMKVGDKLTDNVKNYHMGTVVKVESVPCTKITNDLQNEKIIESVVPNKETVVLTVEADVSESNSDLRVDSGYIVKAGKECNVKGPSYAGGGYILTIEREEAAK